MHTRMSPGVVRAALAATLTIVSCGRQPPSSPAPDARATTPAPRFPFEQPIRAGYFYSYVSAFHIDSLANAGFNRAIVKTVWDPLGARGTDELRAAVARGARAGIDVAPAWSLQSNPRLAAIASTRRYTWGSGTVEAQVGCPLDPAFWRTTFLDRARELARVAPGVRRLVLDLEIYTGSTTHYVQPCQCAQCLEECRAATGSVTASLLQAYQEWRLSHLLTGLAMEFATSTPGVELGVFDLDRDAFVHRAMARALWRARVPMCDYTERTYTVGGTAMTDARKALDALGIQVPVVGGLWFKQFTPEALPGAARSMLDRAEGWFAFTTFSLWVQPSELTGPYTLQGTQAEYWAALRRANR